MLTLVRDRAIDALRHFAARPIFDREGYIYGHKSYETSLNAREESHGLDRGGAHALRERGWARIAPNGITVTLTTLGIQELLRLYPEWVDDQKPWWNKGTVGIGVTPVRY